MAVRTPAIPETGTLKARYVLSIAIMSMDTGMAWVRFGGRRRRLHLALFAHTMPRVTKDTISAADIGALSIRLGVAPSTRATSALTIPDCAQDPAASPSLERATNPFRHIRRD